MKKVVLFKLMGRISRDRNSVYECVRVCVLVGAHPN